MSAADRPPATLEIARRLVVEELVTRELARPVLRTSKPFAVRRRGAADVLRVSAAGAVHTPACFDWRG